MAVKKISSMCVNFWDSGYTVEVTFENDEVETHGFETIGAVGILFLRRFRSSPKAGHPHFCSLTSIQAFALRLSFAYHPLDAFGLASIPF